MENVDAGDSANVDDLLPDRGGVDLPADTFNDGEVSTEAELLEFAEDVDMKPVEEAEVPAGKGGDVPDREAQVPQVAAAASRPTIESVKRAASPFREERRAKDPARPEESQHADFPCSQVHGR